MSAQKDDRVTVEIEDLAYGGLGVGRVGGFVVFVEKALPGESVTARIVKRKSNHAQAVIESIDRVSPHRVLDPPCPLFGTCGGCTWQNLEYAEQLKWKQKQVAETIRRIGGMENFVVSPIVGSPDPWHYRNKMEYSFGTDDEGRIILGFHLPGRFDQIFEVPRCLIHPEPFDAMLAILTAYAREHGLSAYDQRRHEGFMRHAVMRRSHTTGETILALLTTRGDLPDKKALVERLRDGVPGFKGMIWGLHADVDDVARMTEELWRWGEPELTETVGGLTFAISAVSFFQTNTAAAELLYAKVVELADFTPASRVLDAYCGTGAIGLHCAARVRLVVGVEVVTEAIWDARANAARNGIANAVFIAAPLQKGLKLARETAGGFSHVIIDPPRGGMDKKSLAGLIDLRAPVFVYVSCNPATLARDLQTLGETGYRIEAVQPVDLFPHTYHIETIVRLRLG